MNVVDIGAAVANAYKKVKKDIEDGVIAVGRELDQNVIIQNLKNWIADNLETLGIHSYTNLGDKPFITINGYKGKIVNNAVFTIPSTPKDKGMQIVPDIESVTSPDPEIIYKQMNDTPLHPVGQYTWDGTWHRQPLDIPTCKTLNYIKDYEGIVEYDHNKIDYNLALRFFQQNIDLVSHGGCSALRKGNLVGRNFDYTYDNQAEYIIRTNHTGDKYASIGTCGATTIDNSILKSLSYDDRYDLLPFTTVDGINESGLHCEINLVPQDYGHTHQEDPNKTKTIYVPMIVRYILDNHNNALEACQDIANNFNVIAGKEEAHFMICDATSTYILEFINNETRYINLKDNTEPLYNKEISTNFHLTNGAATKVEEMREVLDWDTIEDYGQGLERWQYIMENIGSVYDLDTMLNILVALFYTTAYESTNPLQWKSEFTGKSDLFDITIHSTDEEFMERIIVAREMYANRSRDKESEYFGTWHTTHSVVYDLENKSLSIICQQENRSNVKTYYVSSGESEIDDSESAKYATNKTSSNNRIFTIIQGILDFLATLTGTIIYRGTCTLTDVSSQTAINNQLTQYIQDNFTREPQTGDMLYTKYQNKSYVDYIYGDGKWEPGTDKRTTDLSNDLLTNTYNATNLDFSGENAINKLKVLSEDAYLLQMDVMLNTPITNIGHKDKIGELPVGIGGEITLPMSILRGTARTRTDLIAEWFEPGGEHYINIDELYADSKFEFENVIVDNEEETIGCQEYNGDVPQYKSNGMPKMVCENKILTIADTESATESNPIYVYQVSRDINGNPIPKMHEDERVLDKNGHPAWQLRKLRVYVNKEYLYFRELRMQGCPIDSEGNLGYYDTGGDIDFMCMVYLDGSHYTGDFETSGLYSFRPSYSFSEMVLAHGNIKDNGDGTSDILKPTDETCAGYSIAWYI